jgi:hypothetical protein
MYPLKGIHSVSVLAHPGEKIFTVPRTAQRSSIGWVPQNARQMATERGLRLGA